MTTRRSAQLAAPTVVTYRDLSDSLRSADVFLRRPLLPPDFRMDDRIPALVFGALLVIGGSLGLVWHVRSWRRHRSEPDTSDSDRHYYRRQFSRRIQATGLIVLIGVMLPIGDLHAWKNYPGGWAIFWMIVLALAMWVLLLGCRDLMSTRVYSRDALSRLDSLREKQRELEQEIARIRARSPNGRPPGL